MFNCDIILVIPTVVSFDENGARSKYRSLVTSFATIFRLRAIFKGRKSLFAGCYTVKVGSVLLILRCDLIQMNASKQ